ncbi:MAG: signal recognition particle-docking protein FtsY [Thermaerobacterales bacterium]
MVLEGGLLQRFRAGLTRTREALAERLRFGPNVDAVEALEALEEALIGADVGMPTTMALMDDLRSGGAARARTPDEVLAALHNRVQTILGQETAALNLEPGRLNVVLFVGVNGTGKTTSVARAAHLLKGQGRKVLLAAGDPFRAAAAEQLEIWGSRLGVDVIRQKQGADPAAVAFDAVQAGRARGADVVLIDTAGRLHTQVNLMEELRKIKRVVARVDPTAPHEVLLTLDATNGQNALIQARLFHEVMGVTGIILTKLDSSAKGGIILAIRRELELPIKFVGLGEGMEDLAPFDPALFADALLGELPQSAG